MSVRRCIWCGGALLHLVVVACGACSRLPDWDSGHSAQAVRWYARMSAADAEYAFFAPQVGAPHRGRFLLQDDTQSQWWDTFDRARCSEARLRLTGIVDSSFMSGDAGEWPEWRTRLVSSWAAKMFTRHPTAVSQTVVVEAFDVPTMAGYRAGERPRWQEVYRAEFRRRDTVTRTGGES